MRSQCAILSIWGGHLCPRKCRRGWHSNWWGRGWGEGTGFQVHPWCLLPPSPQAGRGSLDALGSQAHCAGYTPKLSKVESSDDDDTDGSKQI